MEKRLCALCILLALTACGPAPTDVERIPTMKTVGQSSSVNPNKNNAVFTDYRNRLVGRGTSAVLFFTKPSDLFSLRSEAIIRRIYGSGSAVVTTYRVDFPTATGARLAYGVLVEDTFVLLDPAGERVASFIHPSEEEIRIILRGNIPVPANP